MKPSITLVKRSDGSTNSTPDSVEHDFLIDVADAAVDDPSLDDDRPVAEGEAEFVQGNRRWRGNAVSTCAPPWLISLMAIGWKTITSPCRSPRI